MQTVIVIQSALLRLIDHLELIPKFDRDPFAVKFARRAGISHACVIHKTVKGLKFEFLVGVADGE